MSVTSKILNQINNDVVNLKDGLNPENISYWYEKIINETREMAPPWLTDKINVKQDPILPLKFDIDISKRAVRYFMQIVDANLDSMPYSTKLYFLKVEEILSSEMDKSLVRIYPLVNLTEFSKISSFNTLCSFSMTDWIKSTNAST